MSIEKPIYDKRDLKRLNGNVIDITPLLKDEWWKIKEEETNGKEETKKRKEIKVASYIPEIDNAIIAMEYWEDAWLSSPYKDRFKNAYDYMQWSLQEEDQPFSKGGLVTLMRLNNYA